MSRLVVIVGFPRHVESFLKRVVALNLEVLPFPHVQILQPCSDSAAGSDCLLKF